MFRALCPTSFTTPPKVRLPELELSIDCKATLASAERLATTSDLLRTSGSRITNVLNVKSQGDTWFDAQCAANIMLSNGEKATLDYRQVPRSGKYVIEAKVVK